ncbi:aquaporin family protein [Reichenbachiella carrageenanivorans]|uniref:Aquaporin family protein n=1 Tax=Reichenbachiella carrageenanivorans TaxID=2979869 RepID=A0ABY6D361_9BACT|nr:MIP/aquaporin family protein [Reichenbachiella carrageenanivorans]UXX80334.1 aquaporin family protein [Reichenbachiella carrageenanivorans]
MAEFLGTAILFLLGGGVNAGVSLHKNYFHQGSWLAICVGWGIAVAMAIYAVGDISGSHINPAVTLGFALTGAFEWAKVPGYMLAQLLGAMAGATLVWLHYLPHWKATENTATKRSVFCTSPAIPAPFANLFSEIFGTFILLFALSFLGLNDFTEGLNPLVIGLLVCMIGLSLGGTTGFAINPARDLGPRFIHFLLPIAGKGTSGWNYSWIPIVGPFLGGALGTLSYQAIFNQNIIPALYPCLLAVVVLTGLAIRAENSSLKTP